MDFLKKNAIKFLKKAEESFKAGEFNFTMFFVEQFFQLTLKYLIGKRYGDFPKIHSLKSLFELSKDDKLINFYKQNLDTFREIELSYIASRYLDIDYSDAIAEKSLKLANEFLEVVSIEE